MFEIIGLFIAAAVFFAFSAVIGLLYAFLAWLLLRRRPKNFLPIGIAAVLPPICAIYIAVCLILMPGESLFGDITEPLPNGFVIKALGKMPDYGNIESKASSYQPPMQGWIGRVVLDGDILYGTYSHNFNSTSDDTPAKPCCFAFNTKAGTVVNFESVEAMNQSAHRPLSLIDIPNFHSNPQAYHHQMMVQDLILFVPCALMILLYTAFLLQWRRRTQKSLT